MRVVGFGCVGGWVAWVWGVVRVWWPPVLWGVAGVRMRPDLYPRMGVMSQVVRLRCALMRSRRLMAVGPVMGLLRGM